MIKVLKEGLFSTIQDSGRFGYKNIGVPVSGPMDQTSAKLANLILGNDESAAVLEMTLLGPTLEFLNDTYISITETDKRTDYLGKEIAIKTEYLWKQNHTLPINVVLGDEWYAGNLSYHLNSRPVWEGLITKNKLNSLSKFICIDNICVGNR